MLNEVSDFSEVFELIKSLILFFSNFIKNERIINEKLIKKKTSKNLII